MQFHMPADKQRMVWWGERTACVSAGDPQWSGHTPPGSSRAAYRLYNIGNHRPENLLRLLEILEGCLGKKAMQRSDRD